MRHQVINSSLMRQHFPENRRAAIDPARFPRSASAIR
jgi:hypothetical protein